MGDYDRPMDDSQQELRLEVVSSVHQVPEEAWDACIGEDNPFVEHRFLATLEDTGCLGGQSGWHPHYLLVRQGAGSPPAGIAPLYVKTDSYGEYIFDWAWANGAQRAGLDYYPKLTAAVPFTPATGPRLLVRPDVDAGPVRDALAGGALVLADRIGASGVHWLFCTEAEASSLQSRGYTRRRTYQFHWKNQGYEDFDAFLDHLQRKRRKEVRRERRKAHDHGLRIELKTGETLTPEDWRAMRGFYDATHQARPWQRQYLRPDWWELAADRLRDRAVAVLAYDGSRAIAGSLSFRRGRNLYGRYWGAAADLDAVHFECCYYRLVEYAIDEGIQLFEAGAQGQHKLRRGFLPALTHSAHRLTHPGLHDAVEGFIGEETAAVLAEVEHLRRAGPFRD